MRGATGRSVSLTSSLLTDENTDLSILTDPGLGLGGDPDLYAQVLAGEILLQPNMGLGTSDQLNAGTKNQLIDENNPVFVVEEVTVVGSVSSIEVDDSQGESMLEVSDNIGTNYAPIAAAGDSYLIGRLQGVPGGDLGGFQRGGVGALPYVVVNDSPAIMTTGGGGGGRRDLAGDEGEGAQHGQAGDGRERRSAGGEVGRGSHGESAVSSLARRMAASSSSLEPYE